MNISNFVLDGERSYYRDHSFNSLKMALSDYERYNCKNEDMIEYLLQIFLKDKEENQLFMPEMAWAVIKTMPLNHKFVKMIIPDEKAFEDVILFKNDLEKHQKLNIGAYDGYYRVVNKCKIWGDLAGYIVSRKGAVQKLMPIIKNFKNEDDNIIHIANMLTKLMRESFSLSKFIFLTI